MTPNHPYSYPPAHTMVRTLLQDGTEALGYHDGQSIWFTDCGQVELRIVAWAPLG